eukprot:m.119279 g.119279  ORF g.119279 m.119279 type:complete len:315 (+) comp14310_c0_seq2:149-1093(+)
MRTAVYSSVGRRYHGITTEKSVSEWDTFVVANDITGATTSCAHKSEERHEDKVEQKTEEDSKEFYQPPVHPLFLRGSKRIQRNQRKRRRVRETKDQPSKKLQQTVLDLGQKSGYTTCSVCHMMYARGQPNDEKDHKERHDEFEKGVKFGRFHDDDILKKFGNGDYIAIVQQCDKTKVKVPQLLEIVNKELGYSDELLSESDKLYIYMQRGRGVGCVIVEPITCGYPIIVEQDIVCIMKESPKLSRVGIQRLWVHKRARKHGIATALVDCVRANFVPCDFIETDKVAFSQPTKDGRAFAAKYCKKSNFLVYNKNS